MKKTTIAGISAAALAAGLGFGASTLASAETASPSPSASASAGGSGHGATKAPSGPRLLGVSTSDLASALGVEEDTLTAAIDTVAEATEGSSSQDESASQTQEQRKEAREQRRTAFVAALAEELGLDEDTVSTAVTQLRAERQEKQAQKQEEALASAVSEGTLTSDEAAAVQKALDEGIVSLKGSRGR